MRTIRTYGDGQSRPVADVVAGVFAAELIAPSRDLWIVSPWISDIPVLDNSTGRLTGLPGSLPMRLISLVEVLGRIARAPGARITVVTRDVPTNSFVVEALRTLEADGPVRLMLSDILHEKTLLTDRVMITGSMNFTFNGTSRNEEQVTVLSDPAQVAAAHVQFADRHRAGQ